MIRAPNTRNIKSFVMIANRQDDPAARVTANHLSEKTVANDKGA